MPSILCRVCICKILGDVEALPERLQDGNPQPTGRADAGVARLEARDRHWERFFHESKLGEVGTPSRFVSRWRITCNV